MALRAVASFFGFGPIPSECLADCGNKKCQDLIAVNTCFHIFCKECLQRSLESKLECPSHPSVLHPIGSVDGEYASIILILERFTYYVRHEFSTLKEKLTTEKVLNLASCEFKKTSKNTPTICAVCRNEIPYQLYFIQADKDLTKIGRYMHEDCLQKAVDNKTVDNDSVILDISLRDMVKVAIQLSWPPKPLAPEPIKPASPLKVFFVAIILPISLWALAMNSRIYHNKSFFLFVLSLPALAIFWTLSALINGIKAIFSDKL